MARYCCCCFKAHFLLGSRLRGGSRGGERWWNSPGNSACLVFWLPPPRKGPTVPLRNLSPHRLLMNGAPQAMLSHPLVVPSAFLGSNRRAETTSRRHRDTGLWPQPAGAVSHRRAAASGFIPGLLRSFAGLPWVLLCRAAPGPCRSH